jgi:hypothetical protein
MPFGDAQPTASRVRCPVGTRRGDVFVVHDGVRRADPRHVYARVNRCEDRVDRDAGTCEYRLTGKNLRITHNQALIWDWGVHNVDRAFARFTHGSVCIGFSKSRPFALQK